MHNGDVYNIAVESPPPCTSRVKGVASPELEHLIRSGRSIELSDHLDKEGDGCVVASCYADLDLDNPPKENQNLMIGWVYLELVEDELNAYA